MSLIHQLLIQGTGIDEEAIVLDFFAGSSTTAEATMRMNKEEGRRVKFIMVQLPEQTDEKSNAFNAGFKNLADLSKERIRRAGKKVLDGESHDSWDKDIKSRWKMLVPTGDVYFKPKEQKIMIGNRFASVKTGISLISRIDFSATKYTYYITKDVRVIDGVMTGEFIYAGGL